MQREKLTFTNSDGEELTGRLDLPADGKVGAYALFAHCFTCNKDLTPINNISRALTTQGIAVLRFDFTGLGESEGDFAETNFTSNVQDLIDAANFLEEHYEAPKLIIGHSLGGAAVLMAAASLQSVEAVATIAAPSEPSHVQKLLQTHVDEIRKKGEANVKLAGRTFTIKKQLLDDLENANMNSIIANLKKPLLVLHSPADKTVGVNNAAEIYQSAMHPKSFISLDQADHLMSKKEDSLYAGTMIATWVKKYITMRQIDELETEEQVVTRTGKSYTTEARAGKHGLTVDEPQSVGGANLGPNPYDYLLTALGSCTGMTLRMYADHKKLPLEEVHVHLSHKKVHANDCEECENKDGKIDYIERQIEVEGDLDEKQRQRLLEIANKCPVHRTLHNEIHVASSLKE